MTTEFTIDPEFRDLLPPLSDDEFQRLRDDINKNGCRDKLVVWKEWNILIDGHNRHDICTTLDLPYETMEMSFRGREEVQIWMIRNQLSRRNISDAMRVVLNLKLKPVLAAKAKANIKGGDRKSNEAKSTNQISDELIADPTPELNTTKEIAKASNVSHDTVHKVETVMAKADEPTKAKMLAGDISINKAHKIATGKVDDEASPPSFDDRWFDLFAAFSKKIRALSDEPDAKPKAIAHDLRSFAKEFDR